MIFILTKADGKIGKGLIDYIAQLSDGKYRVIVERFVKSRSTQQNRLYWSYLRLIEYETGQDSNDLHEYLKRKLLPPRFVEVLGEEIKLPATTTKLDSKDFGEYLDKIEQLTGIPIPTEINI
jgi:hypothetical protein